MQEPRRAPGTYKNKMHVMNIKRNTLLSNLATNDGFILLSVSIKIRTDALFQMFYLSSLKRTWIYFRTRKLPRFGSILGNRSGKMVKIWISFNFISPCEVNL